MKQVITLMILTLTSVNSFSQVQNTSNSNIDLDNELPTGKALEIGLSITNRKFEGDNQSIAGLEFSAGKIFNLTNEVSTTTSVIINRSKETNENNPNDTVTFTEMGLGQKVSLGISNRVFPFLEASISKGTLKRSYESQVSNYTQLSAGLGVQFAVTDTFRPFAKYARNSFKTQRAQEGTSLSVFSFGVAFLL